MNLMSLLHANFLLIFLFVFLCFVYFSYFCIPFQDILFLHPDTAHAGGPNTSYEIRKMVYFRLKIKCGNKVTIAMRKITKKKNIKNGVIASDLDRKTSESLENDKNSLIDINSNLKKENFDQNDNANLNIDKNMYGSMINNNSRKDDNNNYDTMNNNNGVNISDITKENVDEKSVGSDRILFTYILPSSTSIDTNSTSSIFMDWNSVTVAHSSDMWADLMGVKTLDGI